MFIYCGGEPIKQKVAYYKTRLRQKLSLWLFKYTRLFSIPENAISRTHPETLATAKKIKTDIYIAHNLGALPAAVIAAKSAGVKVGYDAEDMNSGQFTSTHSEGYLLNRFIEEKYFSKTDYFTAASPLIGKNYKNIYPFLNPVIINNVFPRLDFQPKALTSTGAPALFWFSQTIGPNRGIETVIEAMGILAHKVTLHILGRCSDGYRSIIYDHARLNAVEKERIHVYAPLPPDQLFEFASQFDIGMATETGVPFNRDICLTNKIFTYAQCGLALMLSDTQAQTLFIREFPQSGKLYKKNDADSLAIGIEEYILDQNLLHKTKTTNFDLGQRQLNWDSEKAKFIKVIERTIQD